MRRHRPVRLLPAPPGQRSGKSKGGGRGLVPPQVYPVEMNDVKGILREFDRGAYGEEFRGDRLAKIAILGKGYTSTVWKMVDVDTLRVVAVKEILVCNSTQSAILRHELGVLHPQRQQLVSPKRKRLSGRRNRGLTATEVEAEMEAEATRIGAETSSAFATTGGGPPSAAAAAAAYSSSSRPTKNRKNEGVNSSGAGGTAGGSGGGGRQRLGTARSIRVAGIGNKAVVTPSPDRRGPCRYMPRYFGSFVSQDDAGRPRVSMVLEHIQGVDLGRWMQEEGSSGEGAAESGHGGNEEDAGSGRDEQDVEEAAREGGQEKQQQQPEGLAPLPPPHPARDVWLARVCRDMLEALRYLHERRCIHRDVKPSNILLGPGGARLTDFGSTVSEDEAEADRMHGTTRFMSPERLCAKPYRRSSDLWAAALTVATAALGENPIPKTANNFEAAEYAEVAFERVLKHPAACRLSPTLRDFLRVALVADPDKRPSVEHMLSHPFVTRREVQPVPQNLGGGGRGGDGGSGTAGFFGAVRRGNMNMAMLSLGGRRKEADRARGAAVMVAAAAKLRLNESRRKHQQPSRALLSSGGSGGGGGSGCRNSSLEDVWNEGTREMLHRLARKSIGDVDASDIVRTVLVARWDRWRDSEGLVSGLSALDFSYLAVELGVSSAELRSDFERMASDMEDGESYGGSFSSPGVSPFPGSPARAALSPISVANGSGYSAHCFTGRSLNNYDGVKSVSDANQGESRPKEEGQRGDMPPSPMFFPTRRSPLPRRRPPPLIVSPDVASPRPVSGVSTSTLSVISGRTTTRSAAVGSSPFAAAAVEMGSPAPALAPEEAEAEEAPAMSMSTTTTEKRVVSAALARSWTGTEAGRRGRSTQISTTPRVDNNRSGRSRPATVGKSGCAVVLRAGGSGGAWWKKGWGQGRRLLHPRVVVKVGKQGGSGGSDGRVGSGHGRGSGHVSGGGGGTGISGRDSQVDRTTDPPSTRSAATTTTQLRPFPVTPPLSKFEDDADGVIGGKDCSGAAMTERDLRLLAQAGTCMRVVRATAKSVEVSAALTELSTKHQSGAAIVLDERAPAWSSSRR